MVPANINKALDYLFGIRRALQSLQRPDATIKTSDNAVLWKLAVLSKLDNNMSTRGRSQVCQEHQSQVSLQRVVK